jgi:hypothetical protein
MPWCVAQRGMGLLVRPSPALTALPHPPTLLRLWRLNSLPGFPRRTYRLQQPGQERRHGAARVIPGTGAIAPIARSACR